MKKRILITKNNIIIISISLALLFLLCIKLMSYRNLLLKREKQLSHYGELKYKEKLEEYEKMYIGKKLDTLQLNPINVGNSKKSSVTNDKSVLILFDFETCSSCREEEFELWSRFIGKGGNNFSVKAVFIEHENSEDEMDSFLQRASFLTKNGIEFFTVKLSYLEQTVLGQPLMECCSSPLVLYVNKSGLEFFQTT